MRTCFLTTGLILFIKEPTIILMNSPDNETCLKGGVYVSKDHPRILFRGALDSLEADILEAQITASQCNGDYYVNALGEVLEFARELMSAEVNERPVALGKLFGMSLDDLRGLSHEAQVRMPEYALGALPVRLNTLRTRVRETEIAAVRAFRETERDDIIHALNRLSSAVYWLYCRSVSEKLEFLPRTTRTKYGRIVRRVSYFPSTVFISSALRPYNSYTAASISLSQAFI
jgi:ethanolamine utilization cobalamin adenosyltransferase